MKRKVIQIAGSTMLVSLPRQWAKRNNIQRGQEIEVQENGDKVTVTANSEPLVERAELDISDLGDMTARSIHALYKKGVDELRVTYDHPSKIRVVQDAIGKEAVGFEILEQGKESCTIRYVHGAIEEFDSVLRRTFLLMLTMANQAHEFLREGNYEGLQSTAFLEEANNRFTTICRRYLNKSGSSFEGKIGPMYYIIEELEKVADQYKYLCQHFHRLKGKNIKIDKNVLKLFDISNEMLRSYYELFYRFDGDKLEKMKEQRNKVVNGAHKLLQKDISYADNWLIYHALVITNKVFGMTGPLMVLKI